MMKAQTINEIAAGTINEMAAGRSREKAAELANVAIARGISAIDLLCIWAGIIAHNDPRLARLSLESLEEVIGVPERAKDEAAA